jgi:DNA gyrase subunit B
MPAIIDKGYLYIAQPPLYRAKRGNSEVYLKDNRALDNYLIDGGLADVVLTLAGGAQMAGADLRALAEQARTVKALLANLSRRLPMRLIEQTAIAGMLKPAILTDLDKARQAAGLIAGRLDALEPLLERGWHGHAVEGDGLVFSRTLRGVTETHHLAASIIRSAEARKLDDMAARLSEVYGRPAELTARERKSPITGPVALLDAIMEAGRKGIAIQRYKGLGEMNPGQLWETTLDPDARTLLQVKVAHIEQAEEVFSTLMGDVVDPRREFIQSNALKVANLDV